MAADDDPARPGTADERVAQRRFGTRDRALRFYADQLLDRLTPQMAEFVEAQTQFVIASVGGDGRPDASVRFGHAGFVSVLGDRSLCWPELRGNGVLTTLGNIVTNPAVHLMFLSTDERIGLHLRGDARIVEHEQMSADHPDVVAIPTTGRGPERWVVVDLSSSYVHCRKHFPSTDAPIECGTDDPRAKGGDFFGAKSVRTPWSPGTE